ncbi:MAG: TIGR03619 family F420-dependent LLM class oxidoreductase [Alphaproteobacteria bacterium]|jgi:probable F420-dependent oxidoreductase|nr:TIGR03619 family F420-dependent LLM class oxidoreductase [Alphaproteobacteria bacterium]MDP6567885.1 TIGR03619 family F420-dependent LLM class oxidoreductase [Alphaproteobacteria bacterium]MDP6815848.1 TIGR03619 family F420-dependent LLM class oxidoreductase [Alphaproteobacteria bacterium]
MQYGLMIMTRGPGRDGAGLLAMARAAEAGGLEYLAINDHVLVPGGIDSRYPYSDDGVWAGAAAGECLETVTAAAFIAAATSRIRLLTSVLVVPHRPAALAAKMLTTVEVLSGGRLTVGCGAGWMREEFEALQLPPFAERGKVTDEYIAAFRELWTAERSSFSGDYVSFSDVVFEPKPLQKPHPPVWIGGESPPAIRRAARLGDGWYPASHNPAFLLDTPGRYAEALKLLHEEADKQGRDPRAIHRAYLALRPLETTSQAEGGDRRPLSGTPAEVAEDIAAFAERGVETIIFNIAAPELDQVVERVNWLTGEVLPLAR